MAKYAHPDVLDNGPAYIKANCDKVVLVPTYTFGDNYSTVNAAAVADAAMTDADFTLSSSGNNRILTTAEGKLDPSGSAGGGAGNHIAFLDTVAGKVLWVTEETSGQAIVAGNPVEFPSLVYISTQPIAP